MSFQDLRIALRTLLRNPAYLAVALLTLTLGIGANAAVFSLVDGVLLSPLDYPEAQRLVDIREVNGRGHAMNVAWHNFTDWRAAATRFEGLAAYTNGGPSTVLGAGDALRVGVAGVSEGFFRTLGVAPEAGRTLLADDHHRGSDPVVVVSDGFWRRSLGARPDLGRTPLTVDGHRVHVVGVMPAGFARPEAVEIWFPLELDQQGDSRTAHNYRVVGRLKPGATLPQARAELDAITQRFGDEPGVRDQEGFEDYFPQGVAVVSLQESIVGDMRRPLWILLGASLLVLLVACTNLASTTLARGTAREHEYAVRHALGAGRARMVSAIGAEVLVLAGLGVLGGLVLALAGLRILPLLAPAGLPRLGDVHLNGGVVGFAVLLAVLAAAGAGLPPALRISRKAAWALRSGARGGMDARRQRIWKWLVGGEMALALMLLIGSGLLLKSFLTVLQVEPGFRTRGLLTATVDPPSSKYGDNAAKRLYYDALLERLRALPGVADVGLVEAAPMTGVSNGLVDVEGGPKPTASGDYQLVTPGYFHTLGIPLLRGRVFNDRDDENAGQVVIVNRAFAALAWPGENPVGKRMSGGGMDDYWNKNVYATVVGVVGDIRQRDLTAPPRPTYYFALRQRPFRSWSMTAVLRPVAGRPVALVEPVRNAIHSLDSDVPVRFATMQQRVGRALASRRFIMLVILAFAGVALALAAVGVYGVVAYAVERRRREIGIRLALGAEPRAVRRALQREYLIAGGLGALVGVAGALILTRVMGSLLFQVRPSDPLTFGTVVVLLGAVAWLASFIPSQRSTRVDPLETMRAE